MASHNRRILDYQFTWRYKDESPEPEQPRPSQQRRPSRRPKSYAPRSACGPSNRAGPFRTILPRQIPRQQVAMPCRPSGRPSFAETPRNLEPLRCPEQTRYPEPHLSSHTLRSLEPPGSHEQTICPESPLSSHQLRSPEPPGSHERPRSPELPKSSDRPGRSKQPKSPTRPLVCSTRHRAGHFRHLLPQTVSCQRVVPIPRRIPERPSSPKALRSLEQSLEQPAGQLESSEQSIPSKRPEPPTRLLVYGNRRRAEPYPRLLPKALPRQRVPIPRLHKSTSKERRSKSTKSLIPATASTQAPKLPVLLPRPPRNCVEKSPLPEIQSSVATGNSSKTPAQSVQLQRPSLRPRKLKKTTLN